MATATRHKPRRSRRNKPNYKRPERIRGFQGDDITLDGLALYGVPQQTRKWIKWHFADIAKAVTEATLTRTIEGASTIELTVADDRRKLVNSRLMNERGVIGFDELLFQLVHISKESNDFNLVFEDYSVAQMRLDTTPRKASRDDMTRAEFVRTLIKECNRLHGTHVRMYSPELHKRQPIKSIADAKSEEKKNPKTESRGKGLGAGDVGKLKVKGAGATAYQLRQAERALDSAGSVTKNKLATLAMICAGIGESGLRAVKNPRSIYSGVFQADPSNVPMEDTEQQAHYFMVGGKGFQAGGAIHLAKTNPHYSPGTIATMVEAGGAAPSFYDVYEKEAQAIIDAYGGPGAGGSTSDDSGSEVRVKRYYFARGQGRKRENTWDCAGRLAEEVGWRRFMVHNAFYFISEVDLYNSMSRYTFSEDSPGVDSIDFEVDSGKSVSEVTVICRASRWAAPPGTAVTIEDLGPVNGKWLVTEMTRSLFNEDATITLKKPIKELPEPAPETQTVSSGGKHSSGGSAASGPLRDRIVAEAKKTLSSKTGHNYYLAGGQTTLDPLAKPPLRSDCSQWVSAIYHKAGAPNPGNATPQQAANGKRTNNPKPGDLLISPPHHVELYVGGGKTIGHGSRPIDYWTVAGMKAAFSDANFYTYDFLDK